MAGKRNSGEGSVFFDKAKSLWGCYLHLRQRNGRLVRVWRYAKTRTEVLKKLRALQLEATAGRLATGHRVIVANFLAWWLEHVAQPNFRLATWRYYRGLAHNHTIPIIGRVALRALEAHHIDELLAGLAAERKSPRLRQQVYDMLKKAFAAAVRRGMLVSNPCAGVAGLLLPPGPGFR